MKKSRVDSREADDWAKEPPPAEKVIVPPLESSAQQQAKPPAQVMELSKEKEEVGIN
jgi:hypothetical protein